MTNLTDLASRITDHSNTISQAEQGIVSTLRQMHEAGAQVIVYGRMDDGIITVLAFEAGADTDEMTNAIINVELSAVYADDDLDFADYRYA